MPCILQVMKALCYVAKLSGGLTAKRDAELSRKLLIFSSKISGARTTLRLIDDIPLLQYTLEYGLGRRVGYDTFAATAGMPPH